MKILLVLTFCLLGASCAPMPDSLRGYGDPKWQPVWRVMRRTAEV